MRRLFHGGLVGASAQILAVAAATGAVTIALRCGLVLPASGAAESELQSAIRLLLWIDLAVLKAKQELYWSKDCGKNIQQRLDAIHDCRSGAGAIALVLTLLLPC